MSDALEQSYLCFENPGGEILSGWLRVHIVVVDIGVTQVPEPHRISLVSVISLQNNSWSIARVFVPV